ncbi:MAG TPA: thiamine phosphate synthase [Acidimicrobiales bacterium]|nr:thiamine phosphate synthase [Acidimicrobiales bacterium]
MADHGLGDRHLYLCTADRPDLVAFVDACIRGGVDIVQLRDKDADARTIIERATLARSVCRDHGVPFILNDRADLALDCDADGVHVGQQDAPPALVRRIVGADKIVGLSTRGGEQLAAAHDEPIDYASVGPVHATATHPERAPVGLDTLRAAAATASLPFVVTGNVNPDTVGPMLAAGATRFVVVRWLTEASDPYAAALRLRAAIDAGLRGAAAPAGA